MTIAKKIHQYWDTEPAPSAVLAAFQELKEMNPGYAAKLWSKRSARVFIESNLGGVAVACFDDCNMPAMQSDFFRYCVLLLEGGVYLDSDDAAVVPLDRWLASDDELVLPLVRVSDPVNRGIVNGFIASARFNSVLAFAVGQCIANIALHTSNDVWEVTGPKLLALALRFKRDATVRLADPRDGYIVHFASGSAVGPDHWSVRQGRESVFHQKHPADTNPEQLLSSFSEQLRLTNTSLYDACIVDICAGFYLSLYEARFDVVSLPDVSTQLLECEACYRFKELLNESIESKEVFRANMATWRQDFVGSAVVSFDKRAQALVDAVTSAGPDAVYETYQMSPGLLLQVASSFVASGDKTSAIAVARAAVFFSDYHQGLWLKIADFFMSLDAVVETEALAQQVLLRNPFECRALLLLGRLSESVSDVAAATVWIRQSVAGDAYVRQVWLSACKFFLKNGLDQEALRTAITASEHDENNPAVLNLLARSQEKAGNIEAAILAAKQFVAVSAIEASYILLARLQFVKGDTNAAEVTLETCSRKFPDSQRPAHLAEQIQLACNSQ